jgi:hypothetical protein
MISNKYCEVKGKVAPVPKHQAMNVHTGHKSKAVAMQQA